MKHIEGNGRIRSFPKDTVEPIRYGITALADGGNRNYESGFLPTLPSPDEADATTTSLGRDAYSSLTPDPSRRMSLVANVSSRALPHPPTNRARNS